MNADEKIVVFAVDKRVTVNAVEDRYRDALIPG